MNNSYELSLKDSFSPGWILEIIAEGYSAFYVNWMGNEKLKLAVN